MERSLSMANPTPPAGPFTELLSLELLGERPPSEKAKTGTTVSFYCHQKAAPAQLLSQTS